MQAADHSGRCHGNPRGPGFFFRPAPVSSRIYFKEHWSTISDEEVEGAEAKFKVRRERSCRRDDRAGQVHVPDLHAIGG
jgi:hypothetical protein